MRMIDADKLIKKMTQACPFVLDTHYDSIYGIPIVEAIPIEWIKKWLGGSRTSGLSIDVYSMLNDWGKENEID